MDALHSTLPWIMLLLPPVAAARLAAEEEVVLVVVQDEEGPAVRPFLRFPAQLRAVNLLQVPVLLRRDKLLVAVGAAQVEVAAVGAPRQVVVVAVLLVVAAAVRVASLLLQRFQAWRSSTCCWRPVST